VTLSLFLVFVRVLLSRRCSRLDYFDDFDLVGIAARPWSGYLDERHDSATGENRELGFFGYGGD
jgi:hypothetical protein